MRRFFRQSLISVFFYLVDIFQLWRYPYNRDVAVNRSDRLARLNWIYKSERPVVRAERGSDLEAYFRERLGPYRELPPRGFEVDERLCVSAVGDLMRVPALVNSAGQLYSDVSELIFSADVSFANLESAVVDFDTELRGPNVSATKSEFEAFVGHHGQRYSVLSTANNHILDGGVDGVESTHKLLDSLGISFVGTSRTAEHRESGLIIERGGIRLGFVGATYGVNNRSLAINIGSVVNVVPFNRDKEGADIGLLRTQMEWCRSQGADLIVVSLHWGHEFEFYPRKYQVGLAHAIAEAGADVILGHHPHTIQPIEVYQSGRDSGRKVPIFYSLGNLVSWSRAPYRCLSIVSRLSVVKGRIHGRIATYVDCLDVTPVLQMEEGDAGNRYVVLRKLRNAMKETGEPHVSAAVPFADLVLCDTWRNTSLNFRCVKTTQGQV